jgi:rhamnose transport system ATP-binding protein
MAELELRGVSKAYGGTLALNHVSVELTRGEVHALVGENGSGKSTLLRVAAGAHRPTAGEIVVDGVRHEFHRPADATAQGIVLVTQEGSLMLDLSVTENIFVGRLRRRRGRVDWPGMRRRATDILSGLGAEIDPDRTTRSLAPDLRQIVEIARALSYDSRFLLLDEPTSALDLQETDRLLRTIRALADRKDISVVFVSHRMSEILGVADRFTVLRDGNLVGSRERAEVDEDWLVRAMVGRELHRVAAGEVSPQSQEPLLEVRDLADTAGRVRGVSLDVAAGEIVGLAGLVGAGRSELLETILGRRPRAAGAVALGGTLLAARVRDALAAGLVLVAEDRKEQALLAERSVRENATLTLSGGLLRRRARDTERALPWLERLGVKYGGLDQPMGALSGGNQQKVLIARAMVIGPRLLMLDEPTRGIDLGAKQRIYEQILRLAGSGLGVLMASSELPELLALCHRIFVVREGRIAAHFGRDQMSEEMIIAAATGATINA